MFTDKSENGNVGSRASYQAGDIFFYHVFCLFSQGILSLAELPALKLIRGRGCLVGKATSGGTSLTSCPGWDL